MKGQLRILDGSGHTEIEWDTEVTEGPLSPSYVEAEFDRLVKEGHLAFTKVDGANVQLRRPEFNPHEHHEVTFVPPFIGG